MITVQPRLYRQLGGKSWVWNSVVSSLIFPLPLLGVFSVVNTIALYQVTVLCHPGPSHDRVGCKESFHDAHFSSGGVERSNADVVYFYRPL